MKENIISEVLLQEVLNKARIYASTRQAYPLGNWEERIEEAGWELAEAIRSYDKTEIIEPRQRAAGPTKERTKP